MNKLSREAWEIEHIKNMRLMQKKTSKIQAFLDLFDNSNRTAHQERVLKNVFNSEYKTYSIKFEYEQTKKISDSEYLKLFEVVKKTKQKEVAQSRKERAHELISIGALTEVVKFEKDRGLIAGALLDVLDRINTNEQVKWDLKKRGDDLLHQIELENKAKKEQRQSIKTKISETASKIKDEVKE
jgi:hypothetical protein